MQVEKLKLIAFDLGYTLIYNERVEDYISYLQEKGIDLPKEKVDLAFHLADKTFMREYPGVFGHDPRTYMPWYVGLVNYQLKQRFDLIEQVEYFITLAKKKTFWKPFPHSKQVLESLKEQGFRLALLSNWDSSCRELLKAMDLEQYFHWTIVSSEVGVAKPDAEIFELLMEQSEFHAEEILYVGDNYYDDAIGARKVGIESIILNRFGKQGVEEIKDCKIISSTEELLMLLKHNEKIT